MNRWLQTVRRVLRRKSGITLVELLIAVAFVGLLALAVVRLLQPTLVYFKHTQSRQQAMLQARACLETLQRLLSNGKASTMTISTPSGTPTVQNSRAQFLTTDNSSYIITWSSSPMNSVQVFQTPQGQATAINTILARNVTGLAFGWDMRDPAIITINLQMTIPLDSSGSSTSVLTLQLPPQTVRMIAF